MLIPLLALLAPNFSPARLECESFVDPLGIDVAHPTLSWIDESTEVGARQIAYRIRVASTVDGLDKPDLWDSGVVHSSETLGIPYAGKELTSVERVYWNVQVWDAKGRPSAASDAATWTMHLLHPSDWQAQWIGAGLRSATNPYVTFYLRKEFLLDRTPKRALVFVCGLGQYELSLNGAKFGQDWLSPAWTQYQKTCLADVYDITPALHTGPNAIGMLVGNGMYDMSGDTRGSQQTNSIGPLEAICQIRLEYADGSVQIVGTDPTWKWHASPATYSGVFGGEDWDARQESIGWRNTGNDDHAWQPAVLMPKPTGSLRGITHSGPPLHVMEVRQPVATTSPKPNVIVLDLGQNAPYIPQITARGPSGASLSLWPAEQLYPSGLMDQRTMRPGKHVTYTLRGGAPESWRPAFWYCGSRYWQVEAKDPAGRPCDPRTLLTSFRGLMVHADATPVGAFACSNDLLNKIYNLIHWSMRSNFSHVITDCPHREKSGWLEQDNLMGPSLMYCYDMRRLFAKTVADMQDAQHPDGRVPTMAPEYFFYQDGFSDSVEWGGSFLLVPELMLEWYGDRSVITRHYPAMVRYVDYLTTRAKDGILSNGLGDWNGDGADPRTPVAVTDTAFYYALCDKLAGFAKLVKRPDDVAKYKALAKSVRAAFGAKFLDKATGKVATGSQSCQATALDYGLIPADLQGKAFERLLQDVAAHDYAVSCGEVGHPSLLRVLAAHGRSDVVAKIHLQTDRPGYGYQVEKGLTTLAETWDASPISLNHFMLGHLMEWLYADLVGIKPDPAVPGFKQAIIAPTPVAGITWANGSYDSCRGLYKVAWRTGAAGFGLDVTIPANCRARVVLPKSGKSRVDGGPATRVGDREIDLPAGTYHIHQS